MIKVLTQVAVLSACTLAIGACTLGSGSSTAQAPSKPAAPDYQAPVPPTPPANTIRATCYNEADLAHVRARMVQQELQVLTLQCQGPGGVRAFERSYADFVGKFRAEFATNSRALAQMSGRKRFNVDTLVTDKEFCSRGRRTLDWALDAKVKSLDEVPPPYDVGPDMNIWPCPKQ